MIITALKPICAATLIALPAGPLRASDGGGDFDPKEVVVPRRVVPKDDSTRPGVEFEREIDSERLSVGEIVLALFEAPWSISTGETIDIPPGRRVSWRLPGAGSPSGTIRLRRDGTVVFRAGRRDHVGSWSISPRGVLTMSIPVLDDGEPRSGRVVGYLFTGPKGERYEYHWAGFIFDVDYRQ